MARSGRGGGCGLRGRRWLNAGFADKAVACAGQTIIPQSEAVETSGAPDELGGEQQKSGLSITLKIAIFQGDLCAIYQSPVGVSVADDWMNLPIDELGGLYQIVQLTGWRGEHQPLYRLSLVVKAKHQTQVMLFAKYLSIKPIRTWPNG